jgi:hypothetical protein
VRIDVKRKEIVSDQPGPKVAAGVPHSKYLIRKTNTTPGIFGKEAAKD